MTVLDRSWKNCLRMWKWISENWKEGDNIVAMKRRWLVKNKFDANSINAYCFFCDYRFDESFGCELCPGKLVNLRFYCQNKTYDYYSKPKKFYAKLLHLNAIRKGKNK